MMSPHNQQLLMQAFSINIRVEGMRAENAQRLTIEHLSQAYSEDCFEQMASEMDSLMREVSHEVS